MRTELLSRAMVVTPNIPEAAVLAGRAISSAADIRAAAEAIRDLGPSAVIVTGGHGDGDHVIDVLFDGKEFVECATPRVGDTRVHGTGCTYSAALASFLACGAGLPEAAAGAQAYVAGAIRHALTLGKGQCLLDHFWRRDQT